MNLTSEDLLHIFYSGYPAGASWDVIDDLTVAISKNYLSYQQLELIPKKEFYLLQNTIVVLDGLGPQGKGHMALKEAAKLWIHKKYAMHLVCESYFSGLHPDVLSENHKYVIECGTTDPSCISIYLDNTEVEWAGNIPYPFDEDTYLKLHVFSRGIGYAVWKENKLDIIRQSFRKYHRS
ncbi:hypothetical protein HY947_01965 [Candidatus Gottesmanbacteria bacterium]|nr:hypothetical protein [Candidatus Gottesmanbacteria bacterium]